MDSDMQLTDNSDDRESVANYILEIEAEGNNMENVAFLEGSVEHTYEETVNIRPEKRARGVDEEELWTEVGRKVKIMARSINIDNNVVRVPEEHTEVSIVSKTEKLPKQIGLARILKSENILDIVKIKYINPYKVLVQFSDVDSADKLIQCKYFIENDYKCQKTFEMGVSYGIIRDIELELNEKDILNELESSIPIISAKRLQRRDFNTGLFVESECVRLGFKGSFLPAYVSTYGMRIKVVPYIFPVTQCSKCWRYGHNYKTCSLSHNICPKCGKSHPNCETTTFKCVNCAGKHMALSKLCPVFLKEKRLRELMAEFNCSYKRALTLYVPPSPPPVNISRLNVDEHKVYSCDRMTQPLSSPTYADIVKIRTNQQITTKPTASYSNVTKNSTNKKSNNQRDTREIQIDEDLRSELSDNSIPNETCETDKQEERKKIDVQQLIQKLKDIIFMQKLGFNEKLKSCGKIIYEWVINYLVSYFSEWNFFKSLINNGL